MTKNIMDDYSTLVAVTEAGWIDIDTDHPFGPFKWDRQAQRWTSGRRADVATTTHYTLHAGAFKLPWYRSRGSSVWRSRDGGTPADTSTAHLLDSQLKLQISEVPE